MAAPNAFLPRSVDDAQLAQYRQLDSALRQQALDAKAVDRGHRLVARYQKYPWLTPGIATSYAKWEEQFGTQAARGLARTVLNSTSTPADPAATSGPASFARDNTQHDLESFIATKDFQAQVKRFKARQMFRDTADNSFFSSIADTASDGLDYVPGVGAIKGIAEGKSLGEIVLRAVPGAKVAADIDKAAFGAASTVPGVGPTLKGASRVAFTALESPYQEVQAQASDIIGHVVGGVQQAATGQAPTAPSGNSFTQPAQPDSGLVLGGGQALGSSTGAIALDRLLSGEPVDLGTGYFPGGAVSKEHTQRVRDIASFYYDHQKHFATPGRIFAASVTEPGSDPFNILSGTVDAVAMLKGDPVLLAGGKLEDIRAARKGFDVAPEALDDAGAVRTWWRSTTHGPTVDQFLDTRRDGAMVIDDLTHNYAGKPEKLTELLRRWKWNLPADVAASIINTPNGDRASIRNILGSALGASISEQPRLGSFSAAIRNTTGQHAFFAEIPSVVNDLDALSGPNGSMRAIYNHALGIGLTDEQISTHLHDIISAAGKVERGEAVKQFMNMEGEALRNMGLPEEILRKHSRFVQGDLADAREWFDGNIARGDGAPGVMIDGKLTPIEGPYLQAEYLGNRIWLPPLLGPEGRNRAIAKYGRILGIPGTGFTDLEGIDGVPALAESSYRAARDAIAGSNTALISLQNRLWKPVALLRGAWTLRVIGEEQVRMAMAGYDSLFSHPLRYILQTFGPSSQAEKDLLAYGADQGAMRGAQEGAFGLTSRTDEAHRRIIGKVSDTAVLDNPDQYDAYHKYWADKLITYHEDDPMRALAVEFSEGDNAAGTPLERFTERFMDGDLAGARADLATSTKLLNQGLDTATDAGARAYIDGLYDRLHYYTGGDPDLINTIATGRYNADLAAMGKARGIKSGTRVTLEDAPGEIVGHRKGSNEAHVLFDDGTDAKIPLDELQLEQGSQPRILTRTADNVKVDSDFHAHLASLDDSTKPTEVTGLKDKYDPVARARNDRVVQILFAGLMDIPTTKMSRGPVFMQAYLNEMERLLPYADRDGQEALLAQAHEMLHQDTTVRGLAMRGRYKDLEKAANAAHTVDGLSFDEVEHIAKTHGLDTMRELLYDAHKRNRTLAALQLLFPFGEAFKEMVGSWGRIIAAKPVTSARKLQILVNGARGANPFDYVPGGTQVKGQGFWYTDPSRQGAEMFAYPFSGAVNENLFGVPVEQVGPVQGLSMGLNLMPGVGPIFSFPAMQLMNRYMSDPKWDPIRQFVSPYGTSEPESPVDAAIQQFAPAWFRKALVAWTGNNTPDTQSAKVLNSITMDIMTAGLRDGTYDNNSQHGLNVAYNSAYKKARQLYFYQSTFQFGAPATPSFEFISKDSNHKAVRFSVMRDAYWKLVDEDKKNGTHDASSKFINRFGETAMFVVAPKTLGGTFGEEYTQAQYDWVRKNQPVVSKYPLTYAEFAPRAKDSSEFSYDAYLRSITAGERTAINPKDWARRTNNVLGTIWYDQIRSKLGLKRGEIGSKAEQLYLADKRSEIAKAYPGFREVASDDTRVPRAVNELLRASTDRSLAKSNPPLMKALRSYVDARDQANAAARELGHIGDNTRPGFASSQDTRGLREYLRAKATKLGESSPQFLTLWQDVFAREMSEDQ